jgi:NAD+ synthase
LKEPLGRVARLSKSSLRVPALDYPKTITEITGFILSKVEEAKAGGVVVGLSGGVDSSLTAALCVRALGKEKVIGVLLPTSFTPAEDIRDAESHADQLGIRTEHVSIEAVTQCFFKSLGINPQDPGCLGPSANIRARSRMIMLYYYANRNNFLVAGTGDRSESLIGFFTKHGDGGVDFLAITHLYKTQVRALAEYLGVPRSIAYKPSSPQLYPGHKATDEIPLDYDQLDPVLVGLFDYRLPPEEVSEQAGVPLTTIMEVIRRHRISNHKRALPPMLVCK